MNCFLYQLRFDSPVHFGSSESALSLYLSEDHFRADTLFSALCHTALQLHGGAGLEKLLTLARQGHLLLSDSMPWKEDTFYLPKPCFAVRTARELPADKRKAMKKLAWIPADRFEEYCSAMQTGILFECETPHFGNAYESTRVSTPDEGDARPYPVGLYGFRENCGLYFLVRLEDSRDRAWLSGLIQALGLSGIGGKISSGTGKFTVLQEISLEEAPGGALQWLYHALTRQTDRALLLTTSLPAEEEMAAALEDAGYQLVRRAGFIASGGETTPLKKQTQYFLSAGSVLKNRFQGGLYSVGHSGTHQVFRYSKPLFLGVTL